MMLESGLLWVLASKFCRDVDIMTPTTAIKAFFGKFTKGLKRLPLLLEFLLAAFLRPPEFKNHCPKGQEDASCRTCKYRVSWLVQRRRSPG
mmetsp:Transcript_27911/g.109481  ORF Transcript_27911/g.109481 Transcript_27911/m.109481 type:complete len:91 (-) Transcript_27911:662-934(-)